MNIKSTLIAISMCLPLAATAAGNADEGAKKAETCKACHGDAKPGKLKVVKVNVDENAAAPSRYSIRGIPALLLFKGGKVADQIVGYVPKDVIEGKLQKILA